MSACFGLLYFFPLSLLVFSEPGEAVASEALEEKETSIPVFILKVEGGGTAQVRKKSGVMEAAGARGKLYLGDKVLTDARSAVYLTTNDGSLIKVGVNSELRLESVEASSTFLSWTFQLLKGQIRAMGERQPFQEAVLRLNTPSGAVIARGAELVLAHEPVSSTSTLYVLEGEARYGASGCERAGSCLAVKRGDVSRVSGRQASPAKSEQFKAVDILAAAPAAASGAKESGLPPTFEGRTSLFQELGPLRRFARDVTEESAKRLLSDATTELADAQDRAIGRSREQRQTMHKAVEDGTYLGILSTADSYSASTGLFEPKANGGAENMVAQVVASRFRLGLAVQQADAAGLFTDSGSGGRVGPGGKRRVRTYRMRRSMGYHEADAAAIQRGSLARAVEDYLNTLSYVEARPPDEETVVPAGVKPRGFTLSPCLSLDCMKFHVAREMNLASEGVVKAFRQKTVSAAVGGGKATRQSTFNLMLVATPYFSRVMTPTSCYKEEKNCVKKPCAAGAGSGCWPGALKEICSGLRRVPMRCP